MGIADDSSFIGGYIVNDARRSVGDHEFGIILSLLGLWGSVRIV